VRKMWLRVRRIPDYEKEEHREQKENLNEGTLLILEKVGFQQTTLTGQKRRAKLPRVTRNDYEPSCEEEWESRGLWQKRQMHGVARYWRIVIVCVYLKWIDLYGNGNFC